MPAAEENPGPSAVLPRPSRLAGWGIFALLALGPMFMLATIWRAPTSAGEDDVVYYFPLRVMVGQALREGRWPTWNPYEQCGMPLFADPQSAVGYPPTWLFAALPAKLAYSLNVFLAFALAGCGAYVYLRKIGLVRPAAVFGAVAFQYCGFLVGHRVHLSLLGAAAMLGFGLWCIESLRNRPPRAALALPLVLYLALAAGHWPTFVNLMLIWTVYLLARARPIGRSVLLAGAGVIVALLLSAPQIVATYNLLALTTRQRIGYAILGENSFFPTNVVLACFPFIMGCRTQNFFAPFPWWGAWHLCETLSYVGLTTLMLAAGAVWRLWRRRGGFAQSGLVKLWALLAAGGFVWMLGYYLPTYRLVQLVPVLNITRAPARMVLLVDFAFSSLAAMAIHALLSPGGAEAAGQALARTIRRWALQKLPICMAAMLALLAGMAWAYQRWFGRELTWPFSGPTDAIWASLNPLSPTVWVPAAVLAASAAAVLAFLRTPARWAPLLVAVLLGDLLIVTRSVDVPGDLGEAADPPVSASAELVKAHAGGEPFRVLSLAQDYFVQPSETMAPKACAVFGVENLAEYGPFQYRDHAHLFGMRIFGNCPDWAHLVRRNYLLSLYNVRYLVAQEPFREVIESVVIDDSPPPPDGPNLLSGVWQTRRASEGSDKVISLAGDGAWARAEASLFATLEPGKVYRMEFDARCPEGAGHYLQADIVRWGSDDNYMPESCRLIIYPEHVGRSWRHQGLTFRLPEGAPSGLLFRLSTASETASEVKDAALRESAWERPINLGGRLGAGERVYRRIGEFPAKSPGGSAIYVYENRLCLPRAFQVSEVHSFADAEGLIEELRWHPEKYDLTQAALAVGFTGQPGPWAFESVVLPAGQARDGGVFAANGLGTLRKGPVPGR